MIPYNTTMTVKRPSNDDDAIGGTSEGALTSILTDVPCRRYRVQGTGREERVSSDVLKQENQHRIVCDVTATVTQSAIKGRDIIFIGSSRFEVQTVEDEHGMGHHLEIDCVEFRDG